MFKCTFVEPLMAEQCVEGRFQYCPARGQWDIEGKNESLPQEKDGKLQAEVSGADGSPAIRGDPKVVGQE